jgi:tetratricopeptide (TPR) repeat protein
MLTSDALPPILQPYRSWAWPAFIVLAVLLLIVGVAQAALLQDDGAAQAMSTDMSSSVGISDSGPVTGSHVIGGNVSGGIVTHTAPSVFISRGSTVTISDRPQAPDPGHGQVMSPAPPSMLPPNIPDFINREAELARMQAVLSPAASGETATVRVVTVAGKPGSGKSALAIHLAHELYERFPDGQLYVDLRGADREPVTPITVLDVFLNAAGITTDKLPGDLAGRQAMYRTWLAGRRVLIVLDNAADEAQVEPLLPTRSPAAVLTTSRQPLITVSIESPLVLETLDPDSAGDLLWAVARREPVEDDGPVTAVVAERCGYLPLALRIAGATLVARPSWSMKKLAEALADERTRLEQLSKDGLGRRHLDVRASVDLSYTTLDPAVARSFRLLGAIGAVHFAKDVAVAVVGAAPAMVGHHLDRLIDAQLLEVDQRDDRYRFHDLIRLFARERLELTETVDERDAAQARALGWYVQIAETTYKLLRPARPIAQASASTPIDQATALARLDAERLNLAPLMTTAVRAGQWDLACRFAVALGGYFRMRSAWEDWRRIGHLGLEAAQRSGDERARANVLLSLGSLHELTDELELAIGHCEDSLALSRRLGDRLAEFEALRVLGIVLTKQNRLDEATAYFEEGLSISRELSYGWGEGAALHHLGRIYRRQDRPEDAIAALGESLEVSRRLGNRWGEATNLTDLGLAFRDVGELEQAIACFERSRTIYEELGVRWGVATGSLYLGLALRDHGEVELGTTYLRQSRDIYQELGDRQQLELVLRSLEQAPAPGADGTGPR